MKVKINRDIWEKAIVKTREENRFLKYIRNCKEARICPKCGSHVNIQGWDSNFLDYKCSSRSCNWSDLD